MLHPESGNMFKEDKVRRLKRFRCSRKQAQKNDRDAISSPSATQLPLTDALTEPSDINSTIFSISQLEQTHASEDSDGRSSPDLLHKAMIDAGLVNFDEEQHDAISSPLPTQLPLADSLTQPSAIDSTIENLLSMPHRIITKQNERPAY